MRLISSWAVSGESEAWTTLHWMDMAKSPRIDPASASRALVMPQISRTAWTHSSPSQAVTTTGDDFINFLMPSKKGLSARWA